MSLILLKLNLVERTMKKETKSLTDSFLEGAHSLAMFAEEQKRMAFLEHQRARGSSKASRALGYRKKRMRKRKAQKMARKINRGR